MARLREATVYVTTHRKYFAGTYQGAWIKLRHYPSKELFEARSQEIHSDDPAPRFYYYDWKHMPPGWIAAQKIQPLLFDLISYLLQDYDEEEDEALFNWFILSILFFQYSK